MGETVVRIQALDGFWELVGSDRGRGIVPESVQANSDEWGSTTCRFAIRRDPGGSFPDLRELSPCEIEVAGMPVWRGRVWETPTQEGDDRQISVEGRGDQYHLDDDAFERIYVHSRLPEWRDVRSNFVSISTLSAFRTQGVVESGDRAVMIGWNKGTEALNNELVGVTLDLGDRQAKRIVIASDSMNPNAFATIKVRGHDTIDPLVTPVQDAIAISFLTFDDAIRSATFDSPRRYVSIFMQRTDGSSAALGLDYLLRLTSVTVFREVAYESGGASVFKASDAVRDSVQFAPLLSQDTSLIDDTSLSLPDFGMSEDRTPREVIEAADAYHNWLKKVRVDGRLEYRERPSVPAFAVGPWAGIDFQDASRGAAEPIYNRTVMRGTGPDGTPLKVSRGGLYRTDVVQAANQGAEVDVNSWFANIGSVARDTSLHSSGVASAAFTSSLTEALGGYGGVNSAWLGTFRTGRRYRATMKIRERRLANVTSLTMWVAPSGGNSLTPHVELHGEVLEPDAFTEVSIEWVHGTQPGAPIIWFDSIGDVNEVHFNVDELTIYAQDDGAIGRRAFTRTKVQSIGPASTESILEAFGDTWLDANDTAPFKGGFQAHDRAVRRYLDGSPVHPAHLLVYTGELVHVTHHVDPITGALGRDAPMVSVSYDGAEERADVALDYERDNFQALVSRYGLAVGG